MLSACVLMVLMTGVGDVEVGPSEFARLMQGLHGDLRDVTFVYEGWSRGVPSSRSIEEDVRSGPDRRVGERDYQGGYSFRADGATRLDYYTDHINDGKPHKSFSVHQLEVIFDHKLYSLDRMPETRNEKPTVGGGGPGVIKHSYSPEEIHYAWFFRTMGDPAKKGYKYLGWEEIDGRRCLKVELDVAWGFPEHMEDRPIYRFWIDMERGGHPIQIEFLRGERVMTRTARIALESLTDGDGRERWFPVRGITYIWPFFPKDDGGVPVAYETYQVLDGTVRFNQNLPDAFFSLDWKGAIPETEQLATRRKEFRKPPPRDDPEGIRLRLAKDLTEADKLAKQLEASSPAREPWNWTVLGQAGFAMVAAATLVTAGVRRWIGG